MPKSILKKSENIYISEAERELRDSSHGAVSYGDISYGYEDGHLVEIHQPVALTEVKEISSSGLSAPDLGRRRTDACRGDGVDCIVDGGGSASRGQDCQSERKVKSDKQSGRGGNEDDPFKFDASLRALDKDEEVIETTKTNTSVLNQRHSGDVTGVSRSLVREVDDVTRRQRRSNRDHQYNSNDDGEGYHSDEYENNQRALYKKEKVTNQKNRKTQSAYTVRNPNMAAKRRASERRSRSGMIRDATAQSGKRSGTSKVALSAPELRRARSDDAAHGRGISKGSDLWSSSQQLQSSKQKVSERGSYGQKYGTDSSQGDSQVNEQAKQSKTNSLVSANGKRGEIFEKYRRKSDLITAERGDDSFRSAANGSLSAAHDSFRSERSSPSTHRSAAPRSKNGRNSTDSFGSTGKTGRHHRRMSSSGREREWTGQTQRRPSSRSRPFDVASPSAASVSADESFGFNNSSRITVSSLSARIRQRDMLGAATDSGRSMPVVAQENRQRSLNNGAPSVEGELFGDKRGSIRYEASTGDVSARSFLSDRSGGSSMTGGGHSLGSVSSRSGKRAYSSKESRMHIRDATR